MTQLATQPSFFGWADYETQITSYATAGGRITFLGIPRTKTTLDEEYAQY